MRKNPRSRSIARHSGDLSPGPFLGLQVPLGSAISARRTNIRTKNLDIEGVEENGGRIDIFKPPVLMHFQDAVDKLGIGKP